MTKHGDVQRWITRYASQPPQTDCVFWPFAVVNSGHARARNPRTKRMDSAYRVIWEAVYHAPFPAAEACHGCGNGHLGCINHTHIDPGSHADNMLDRRAHGRDPIGSAHPRSFLTEAQVVQICELLSEGNPIYQIADDFAVTASTISGIWAGKSWTHVATPRMSATTRICEECQSPLPADRQAGKRYCGSSCRNRASGRWRAERKHRAKPTSGALPADSPATLT